MQPSRRQVLLAAGVATVAACTTDKPLRPLPPTPDEAARAHAAIREQTLVDAYAGALHEHPDLSPRLAPLLGDHAAHLAALLPDAPASTPSPTTSPSSTGPRRSQQQVLAALATLEREAAAAHGAAAERAESTTSCHRDLAPLLASLAACEASHAAVL